MSSSQLRRCFSRDFLLRLKREKALFRRKLNSFCHSPVRMSRWKDGRVVSLCILTEMAAKSAESLHSATGNHSAFRYSLVWLDRHIDDDYNRKTLKRLRKIDPDTKSFANERHLTEYIDEQEKICKKSSIILIVSGEFSEKVLSTMHDCACIAIFFIHCYNVQRVEHLKFLKLRKIHTEPADLIEDILHCIEVLKTTVSFSLFNEQSPPSAGKS